MAFSMSAYRLPLVSLLHCGEWNTKSWSDEYWYFLRFHSSNTFWKITILL